MTIVDLGSQDVNGSSRDLFQNEKWNYIGVDLQAGKNVDIVLVNPYDWMEFKDNSIHVIISGQALEHVEFFWKT
ncbi:methyltransferase type 11, partial [bacterium]|nr:methyltransferase type 11 [bacterium]